MSEYFNEIGRAFDALGRLPVTRDQQTGVGKIDADAILEITNTLTKRGQKHILDELMAAPIKEILSGNMDLIPAHSLSVKLEEIKKHLENDWKKEGENFVFFPLISTDGTIIDTTSLVVEVVGNSLFASRSIEGGKEQITLGHAKEFFEHEDPAPAGRFVGPVGFAHNPNAGVAITIDALSALASEMDITIAKGRGNGNAR